MSADISAEFRAFLTDKITEFRSSNGYRMYYLTGHQSNLRLSGNLFFFMLLRMSASQLVSVCLSPFFFSVAKCSSADLSKERKKSGPFLKKSAKQDWSIKCPHPCFPHPRPPHFDSSNHFVSPYVVL